MLLSLWCETDGWAEAFQPRRTWLAKLPPMLEYRPTDRWSAPLAQGVLRRFSGEGGI